MRQSEAAILTDIGRRIRAARLAVGITQEQAAASSGIDHKRWQRLEQGAVNPTVRTLVRVATALGISVWDLLGPARTGT